MCGFREVLGGQAELPVPEQQLICLPGAFALLGVITDDEEVTGTQ